MINHKLIVMKKLLSIITLACVFSFSGWAQILTSSHPEADSLAFAKVRARMDSIRQYRPTVGLVLAGGGARGLAHLGVIKYMEELGIPVDVITGTSMGGLVGGLYALGYKHDQLDSLVRDIEWPVMMSDNIPNAYIGYKLRKYRDTYVIRLPHHYDDEDLVDRLKNERIAEKMAEEAGHDSADMLTESISKMGIGMPDGFLYGLNVRNMLSSVSVGYQDSLSFADLPVPYACVATDLYSMTPKYWTSGNVIDAMRSTMAIPFYFRALRKNGEVLLDGGMRNNFPVDIARAMGADIIIGSDMAIHRELNELNSPVDFLMQTITLLASSTMGPALKLLDLRVHHDLNGYTMFSFDDASVDEIIDQGYQNALAQKELFEAVAKVVTGKNEAPVARPTPAINLAQAKVRVDEVRFHGIRDDEQDKILHADDYPADGLYDKTIVERLLNQIYGTNAFESVSYHLEGHEEPFTLVFDCQKGQTNDFAVGLRADTDETVAVALHYGLGTRRLSGPRLTADLKLGTNPSTALSFTYKSQIGLPTVGVTARTRLLHSTSGYMSTVSDRLFSMAADAFVEDSRMRFGSMRAGVTAEMDPYEHYLSPSEFWTGWDWKSYWLSAFATLKLDTFDDGYFPDKGVRMSLDGRYVFKGYSIDIDPATYSENEEELLNQAVTEDGTVPRYGTVLGSFEGAFSLGSHFTILPKLYVGWYSIRPDDTGDQNCLNPKHIVTIGGFMPNRYTERQIPFFGFSIGYRNCRPISTVAQVDFRYRFARKNFVTARGGIFSDSYTVKDIFLQYPFYAVGLEYARQTIVGPLKVAVQYCDVTGVTAYAGIGFDF